ncbi:hypothetical protein NC651_034791 [Populus alba x Populus x berolinensis]|nr:hypothetical protein NC651_034791 [Populus alba x Populus x berolinensis]
MMKKSEILVEEDGTLAVFPETFEEHKEELQSDIKAEEPWSPTFQLAKGKIILDVGSAVRTQLFCRILESQHGQAGQEVRVEEVMKERQKQSKRSKIRREKNVGEQRKKKEKKWKRRNIKERREIERKKEDELLDLSPSFFPPPATLQHL